MTRQKVQTVREKYPRAAITLLAKEPIENANARTWILPPFEKRELVNFARKLRRVRFRRAIILTDSGHGDVGYGEAKFWAFVANARWREFEGKPFTMWREAKAKKKVALILAVHGIEATCELLHVPQRLDLEGDEQEEWHRAWREARTFVYLQHAMHQHGAAPGRVLLRGENWSEKSARRCGWEVATESSSFSLMLSHKNEPQDTNLAGAELICFCDQKSPFRAAENWHEIENRAAFFDENTRDIWLVRQH